jgi:hypothetical protein
VLLAALALFLVTALPALDRWRRRGDEPSDAPEAGAHTRSASEPSG